MSYTDRATEAYGNKCEWVGCGWNVATCDVHHIGYQEHQDIEDQLRASLKAKQTESFDQLQYIALSKGFGLYNTKTNQLPKDDRIENLAVLCPNHHRYLHHEDLGKGLLAYIPMRKK